MPVEVVGLRISTYRVSGFHEKGFMQFGRHCRFRLTIMKKLGDGTEIEFLSTAQIFKRRHTRQPRCHCPLFPSSALAAFFGRHRHLLFLPDIPAAADLLAEGPLIMGGLPTTTASSALALPGRQQSQESLTKVSEPAPKPKKKICCACPDTKKLRDECIVEHGEAACAKWIEAHKQCLRAEGFNV
ncbi:hypothetical protein Nepgr_007485 [Nepenthes gracilis]|uniref:Cytochrome c oxidase copper chaperone n=1 Tax=Nepenthes gracilis TaxID=150966 RepID=A0AAD3S754_NEPGR|nr:hypothetical protein Nepgr_007485 [Nepenthes gracilis]